MSRQDSCNDIGDDVSGSDSLVMNNGSDNLDGDTDNNSFDPGPVVVVEGLCFSYKRNQTKPALQNLSFSIQAGEFVSLVGANGSGKSTLCKLLQGVNTAPKNKDTTITLCGYPAGSREAASQVIFTGGNETIPQFLTGTEYITYLHKLTYNHRKTRTKAKSGVGGLLERIEEKFSSLGMTGREKDLIADYSHGMMKKAQLIAGLIISPRILIADETLNGIDLESEEKLVKELATYTNQGGTVFVCSHNFELLESCATRVLLLENGVLKLDKTQPTPGDWRTIKNQITNTNATSNKSPETKHT